MKLKRNNIKIAIMLWLRKSGYLCKKPVTPKRIRISKTIWPDGTETHYTEPLKTQPINKDPFGSELHVYHEIKRDTKIKYSRKPTKSKK